MPRKHLTTAEKAERARIRKKEATIRSVATGGAMIGVGAYQMHALKRDFGIGANNKIGRAHV